MAPESESDFSDFTVEEEKKELTETKMNQGQQEGQDEGEGEWVVGGEQAENNSN